jgi:hypothetical protein
MATPVSQINVAAVYTYPSADAGELSFCMSARPDHTILSTSAQYGNGITYNFESFNPATGAFTDTPFPSGNSPYEVPGEDYERQQCLVTVGNAIGTSVITPSNQDGILGYGNGAPTSVVSSGTAVTGQAIPANSTGVYRLSTTNGACQLYFQNATTGVVSGTTFATLLPVNAGGSNNPCQVAYGEDPAGNIAVVAGFYAGNNAAGTGSFTYITASGTPTVHMGGYVVGSPLVYGPDGNFWYETYINDPTMVTPQGVATTVDISGGTEEAPYAVYRGLHNDLLFSAAVGLIDYTPANQMQSLVTLVGPNGSMNNNDQLDAAVIGADGYLYAETNTEASGGTPNLLKLTY